MFFLDERIFRASNDSKTYAVTQIADVARQTGLYKSVLANQ